MQIPTGKLFSGLVGIILLLLLLHLLALTGDWAIQDRFNLDEEGNVPTWFSTALLLLVAVTAFVLRERGGGRIWLVTAIAYTWLSLDEAARLHELFDEHTPVKWIWVYAPFAAAFFVLCARSFGAVRHQSPHLWRWVVGGLVIYAAGGLGLELVAHLLYPFPPSLEPYAMVLFLTGITLEEGLEMIGTAMVLVGCIRELQM
ncbi:MAG: hypothetical protein ACR2QZ_07090 [Woeseiaceae bacterium]